MIAVTLLPPFGHETPLGGKEQTAILFDLSSKFSVMRLKDIMHGYISTKSSAYTSRLREDDIAPLVLASLSQLHVFRPHSTPSLLATLSVLPKYLLAQPSTHFSANRPLGLIAINDLSIFYHQDRSESQEANTAITNDQNRYGATSSLLQNYYQSLTTALHDIQSLFSAPLVVTNHALSTPTNQGVGKPSQRPHLPAVWNNYCTLQIVVERDRVTKFGPGMSVEEAGGEKAQRWEAVTRSGFSGWVNWWGSGGWREEIRERLRALERGGRFSFQVGHEGLTTEDEVDRAKDEKHPQDERTPDSGQL